jgi:hypothetical protein
MIKCLRCGQCCYGIQNNKPKRCRQLRILKDGTTECKVFEHRIGQVICPNWRCNETSKRTLDYDGCPFNSGKPIFKNVLKQ